MWYVWLLLKAATVPGMTKEDYLMSCLSQYLGDTPGIQVLLCSLGSAKTPSVEGEQGREPSLKLLSPSQPLSSPQHSAAPSPFSLPWHKATEPPWEQHVCTSERSPCTP